MQYTMYSMMSSNDSKPQNFNLVLYKYLQIQYYTCWYVCISRYNIDLVLDVSLRCQSAFS